MIIQNFSQTIKQVRNIYCIGDSVARGLHAKRIMANIYLRN